MASGGSRRGPRLHVEVSGTAGRGLAPWLSRTAPARSRGAVSIALLSDQRVRALNRHHRGQDAPTDVLSFPSSTDDLPGDRTRRSGEAPFLGDIVIALGVARRQAKGAGHSLQTELRVLALHGLLHLLGYDHGGRRGPMARLETRLRRKGGLREGLIERVRQRG